MYKITNKIMNTYFFYIPKILTHNIIILIIHFLTGTKLVKKKKKILETELGCRTTWKRVNEMGLQCNHSSERAKFSTI